MSGTLDDRRLADYTESDELTHEEAKVRIRNPDDRPPRPRLPVVWGGAPRGPRPRRRGDVLPRVPALSACASR